jgi:hypothetical protein
MKGLIKVEEFYLLGYSAVQSSESQTTFLGTYRLHLLSSNCCLVHAGFLLGLLFDSEDGGNMFLQDTG